MKLPLTPDQEIKEILENDDMLSEIGIINLETIRKINRVMPSYIVRARVKGYERDVGVKYFSVKEIINGSGIESDQFLTQIMLAI